MIIDLLPTLDLTESCEVNLDDAAIAWLAQQPANSESNPLLNPQKTQEMIEWLHASKGVSWSFGSYLEDRSHLHRLGKNVELPKGSHPAEPLRTRHARQAHRYGVGGRRKGCAKRRHRTNAEILQRSNPRHSRSEMSFRNPCLSG